MAFRLPRFLTRRSDSDGAGPATDAQFDYAPVANGRPDPGEVVWAWVPYEEDASQGKDRPVLVLAIAGDRVTALPLTSKDHDRDEAQELHAGRVWMDIGTGGWDSQGRPSEVRLNRILDLAVSDVRREGAALAEAMFNSVVRAVTPYLPPSQA